ncbi:hypothetical protein B484DRAFT_440111, partial [Ochromonadaceae sp. CCMP2298]
HVRGAYNFDEHPIGPPGCKVVVYESPATRASWAAHGSVGFYTGPALSHYRGFRVFLPETNRERVSETVTWFPRDVVMPGSSLLEHLDANISDLVRTTQALAKAPSLQHLHQPLGSLGPRLAHNLRALQELFTPALLQTAGVPTSPTPTVPVPYMVGVPPGAPLHSPILIPTQHPAHTPAQRVDEAPLQQRVEAVLQAPVTVHAGNVDSTEVDDALRAVLEGERTAHRRRITRVVRDHGSQVPVSKSVAYFNPQLQRKLNADGSPKYRVRGTVGGDKIDNPGDKAALTAAGDT